MHIGQTYFCPLDDTSIRTLAPQRSTRTHLCRYGHFDREAHEVPLLRNRHVRHASGEQLSRECKSWHRVGKRRSVERSCLVGSRCEASGSSCTSRSRVRGTAFIVDLRILGHVYGLCADHRGRNGQRQAGKNGARHRHRQEQGASR